jgi:hypothetical protein
MEGAFQAHLVAYPKVAFPMEVEDLLVLGAHLAVHQKEAFREMEEDRLALPYREEETLQEVVAVDQGLLKTPQDFPSRLLLLLAVLPGCPFPLHRSSSATAPPHPESRSSHRALQAWSTE